MKNFVTTIEIASCCRKMRRRFRKGRTRAKAFKIASRYWYQPITGSTTYCLFVLVSNSIAFTHEWQTSHGRSRTTWPQINSALTTSALVSLLARPGTGDRSKGWGRWRCTEVIDSSSKRPVSCNWLRTSRKCPESDDSKVLTNSSTFFWKYLFWSRPLPTTIKSGQTCEARLLAVKPPNRAVGRDTFWNAAVYGPQCLASHNSLTSQEIAGTPGQCNTWKCRPKQIHLETTGCGRGNTAVEAQ